MQLAKDPSISPTEEQDADLSPVGPFSNPSKDLIFLSLSPTHVDFCTVSLQKRSELQAKGHNYLDTRKYPADTHSIKVIIIAQSNRKRKQ